MAVVNKPGLLMIIPNLDFGGAQRAFASISSGLSEYFEITHVVFNKTNMADYKLSGKLISLEVAAGKNLPSKAFNFLKRIRRLKKIKRQFNPVASLSFLEGANYVNVLSSIGESIVLSVRGSKLHDQNISGISGWFRLKVLIPRLYNKASHVVALNDGIADELKDLGVHTGMTVIHNFLNPVFEKLETTLQKDYQRLFEYPVLFSHGRIAPEKGYVQFAPVFSAIQKKFPDAKWVIAGSGNFLNELKSAIKKEQLTCWEASKDLNESYQVYLLGYQHNPLPFLKNSMVYIFPSLHEGFGNSLLEAMFAGLPVVASDCPYSPREILAPVGDEKSGILVPMKNGSLDQEKWIMEISGILIDENLRSSLSLQAKNRASFYKKEALINQWVNVLSSQQG